MEFSKFNLQAILRETDYTEHKTKIICTIGPSCCEVETLVKMLDAGMTVARLNFQYGDRQRHIEYVKKLKEAFRQRKNIQCAIMFDTKGPEIRTGELIDHKPIQLKAGQLLEITNDNQHKGDHQMIACSYYDLPDSVQLGKKVLLADGALRSVVKEIKKNSIVVELQNDHILAENKKLNLPGCPINIQTISEIDEEDLVEFALKNSVDIIAVSFTRCADDIEQVRDILGPLGGNIKIIAKIENQEGLNNYEEILLAADGIMVARGDLGLEIPPQKVFVAQKWMISKALQVGKPVITATQMMESMVNNQLPTRAEASDVANAVLDGTDAVMLSAETACGKFSVVCVETMSQICKEAEMCYDNKTHFQSRTKLDIAKDMTTLESMAISAVTMSFELKAPLIVVFTHGGEMVLQISKFRPTAHIICVSTEQSTIKYLTISWGVICLRVPSFLGIQKLIDYAIEAAKNMNLCKSKEKAIVIMGSEEEDPDRGDILKVKIVP